MTNNAVNLDITNNSDGFEVSGGTTKRKLKVSGADITIAGSGTSTITFPSSTDTLVGRATTDTLTNKEISSHTEVLELTAGESLVAGNCCYFKSDGKMWKTDADAEATSKGLIGLCLDTIAADGTGTFLIKGKYTTTGLTAGSEYFLSLTTGAITSTKPSATGDIVRLIGYALSTTVLYFDPDKTYLEIV